MTAFEASAVSWIARQPKSAVFSGWPAAQAASSEPPVWPVSVPETAKPSLSLHSIEGRIIDPANPPLPIAPYFPFQALSGGSQTSNLMSESAVGLMTPCTRQKLELIATGFGGSAPRRLEGGDTVVAATIVAGPKTLPARSPQFEAKAPPAPMMRAAAAVPDANGMDRSLRLDTPNAMTSSLSASYQRPRSTVALRLWTVE